MKTKLLTICLLLLTSQVFAEECEYVRLYGDCVSKKYYDNWSERVCSAQSSDAKNNFAAKKIYKSCKEHHKQQVESGKYK